MFPFDRIVALMRGQQTAADLRAALDSIDLPRLQALQAEATVARRAILLTGSPGELKAATAKLEAATLDAERGQAAIDELAPRLAEAIAREADEAFKARHAALAAEMAALAKRLRTDYAKSAGAIMAVAEAERDLALRVTEFSREVFSRDAVAGVTSFDRTAFAIAAGCDDASATLHTGLRLPAIDTFQGWPAKS